MGKKDDFDAGGVNRTHSTSSDEDLPPYAPPSYEQVSFSKAKDTSSPAPNLIPGPYKILTVFAGGTRAVRLPTPSSELEIPIFEGTDTSVAPSYVSTRAKRSSGNAILRHGHRGDLYASRYIFWPFRDPVIRHTTGTSDVKRSDGENEEGQLAVSVKTHSFSDRIDLTIGDTGKTFTWRYGKTQLHVGKTRVLVLEVSDAESSSDKNRTRPLAVLTRTDDTRTTGTSKWDAGNGGQLVIDVDASTYIEEGLLVAGCLMMLKREIDRQRGARAAAIGAIASS